MRYRKKKGGCVMQIVEYIKNLDIRLLVALIGFVGVLIGAFISCFTTFCLDWIKFNREEKIYYKRKKEETYIRMLDIITNNLACLESMKKTKIWEVERKREINAFKSKADLYAKKKIADDFYNILSNMLGEAIGDETFDKSKVDKLVEDIRKDLNFEDK